MDKEKKKSCKERTLIQIIIADNNDNGAEQPLCTFVKPFLRRLYKRKGVDSAVKISEKLKRKI